MFQNQLHEGVELTVRKEYLALAVDDIFLEIEGYRLGIAEILHGFGHGNARLLAYPEKTVYGSAIREYHGSVFEYLYPLAAELLEADTDDFDKGPVVYLGVVFLDNFVKRRFFNDGRRRLRNQYVPDLQLSNLFKFYCVYTGQLLDRPTANMPNGIASTAQRYKIQSKIETFRSINHKKERPA